MTVDAPTRRMIASNALGCCDRVGVRIVDVGAEVAGTIAGRVVGSGADACSRGCSTFTVVAVIPSASSAFSSGNDCVTLVGGSSWASTAPPVLSGVSSKAKSSGLDSIWKKSSDSNAGPRGSSFHTNVSFSTPPSLYNTWSSSKGIGPRCVMVPSSSTCR